MIKERTCCKKKSRISIIPKSVNLNINRNDCDIQMDISVERIKNTTVWGYVTDCENKPVPGVLVRLMKCIKCCTNLQNVCFTYTNCEGFYKFELQKNVEGDYVILLSKCASYEDDVDCDDTCSLKNPICKIENEQCYQNHCYRCAGQNDIRYQ